MEQGGRWTASGGTRVPSPGPQPILFSSRGGWARQLFQEKACGKSNEPSPGRRPRETVSSVSLLRALACVGSLPASCLRLGRAWKGGVWGLEESRRPPAALSLVVDHHPAALWSPSAGLSQPPPHVS